MDFMSGIKPVLVSPTTTLNSGGTASITSATIDTDGYDFLVVAFLSGTVAASGELSAAKLQSSDASGSGYADVTGAALSTNSIEAADDDSFALIRVNLDGHKRYWQAVASTDAAADCPITVVAFLGKANISPVVASNLTEAVNA